MNPGEFARNIEKWNARVTARLQRLHSIHSRTIPLVEAPELPLSQQELLKEAIEELHLCFEQLHVAQEELLQQNEELTQQNEELMVARKAVEAERQRYRELFELAPDGYLVTDVKGNIQEANRAAVRMLNVESQFLVSKPLGVFIDREEHPSFYSLLTQLSRVDQVQEWKVRLKPRNGTPFDGALTVAPVCNPEGKLVALRWLLRDISDVYDELRLRKQAELALQRANEQLKKEIAERQKAETAALRALEREKELSEFKSRFVAMISHEYRTPLTTILSSAEIVERYRDKLTQEKKSQHLQRIQVSANHLTQLVNDVLFINQIEARGVEVKPTLLDLSVLCQELVEDLKLTAKAEHTITFESQGDCTKAYLDEKLLRQILSNLLSNAIKYSPQGGTIRLSCICDTGQGTFRIQDEGIGIPAEDLPQLMQSFYRASNAGTIHGTGLGLAIVKKCLDLHGGQIAVESQVGVGTTFTVTLPLKESLNIQQAKHVGSIPVL